MSVVKKWFLFVLVTLLLNPASNKAFKITYKSGPYKTIDLAIVKNKKDMDSFIWHAANYLGMRFSRGTGLLVTAGSATAESIGEEALGSDVGGALVGEAVELSAHGLSKATFNRLKKHYGAHYLKQLGLAKTVCRGKKDMSSNNLLTKKDSDQQFVYLQVLYRDGKNLNSVGDIQQMHPLGQYAVTISQDGKVSLKEISASGGESCK